jgi:NitT/TauT family transport system substrate-binding protein
MNTRPHALHPTRRRLLAAAAATALTPAASSLRAAPTAAATGIRRSALVLAGPPAAVSWPLIRLADSGALAGLADKVALRFWKDPDQLRLLALEGQAEVLAMPTNVAAMLHARGVKLKLVNVATWGVLWLVSRTPGPKTLADFKGAEIAMPFRGDMPDIVFRLLAARQGLDALKDFKLRYVASPMDAMQLLLLRQVDHALLSEPAVSLGLRKAAALPLVGLTLHRAVDLQQEWGRVLGRPPRMPQAGLALLGAAADDPAFTAGFQRAYAQALAGCETAPDTCAQAAATRQPMLDAAAVADSIRIDNAAFMTAQQARPLVTVMLGTPPIAWLVLALLWFGASDGTPVFTVFIACFPVVFGAALQGTRTLDGQLREMARAFRLPAPMTLAEVYGPHVLAYVFPAWITALGQAWKVVVMAELLASADGVGAALAVARSQLDTAATLAWIGALVGLLLALEYGLLEPIKRELERWRGVPP